MDGWMEGREEGREGGKGGREGGEGGYEGERNWGGREREIWMVDGGWYEEGDGEFELKLFIHNPRYVGNHTFYNPPPRRPRLQSESQLFIWVLFVAGLHASGGGGNI